MIITLSSTSIVVIIRNYMLRLAYYWVTWASRAADFTVPSTKSMVITLPCTSTSFPRHFNIFSNNTVTKKYLAHLHCSFWVQGKASLIFSLKLNMVMDLFF
jgi:hypothetical protein